MEFYDVIKKRQSIRVYESRPIPDDALTRILEAFQAAPSWANTQAWELVLVTDRGVKEQLKTTVSPTNPAHSAILDAPLVVCALGIHGKSGFYKGKAATPRGDWMMFDLGISVEHLCLAAAAEGLGTVHVGLFDYEKAGEILGLPQGRSVVELIPMGYAITPPRQVPRKALEDFVFKNRYGNK